MGKLLYYNIQIHKKKLVIVWLARYKEHFKIQVKPNNNKGERK